VGGRRIRAAAAHRGSIVRSRLAAPVRALAIARRIGVAVAMARRRRGPVLYAGSIRVAPALGLLLVVAEVVAMVMVVSLASTPVSLLGVRLVLTPIHGCIPSLVRCVRSLL
jgi:hypothetical protein